MDYGQIISRSFEIIKRRRYLWWLGILAAITEGGFLNLSQFSNYSTNETDTFPQSMGKLFGDSSWLSNNSALITIFVSVLLILIIVLIYLSLASRAGLMLSADRVLSEKSEWRFRDALSSGRPYVLRLFGLSLLYFVSVLVLMAIFTVPIVFLFLTQQTIGIIIAIMLIIIGLLALFAVSLYISVTDPITQREMVLNKRKILPSLVASYRILMKKVGPLLISYLVSVGIGIGYGILIGTVIMIIGGVLFGIGYLFNMISYQLMISYAVVIGAAFVALLFIIGGVFSAFVSSYWTIVYRQLNDGSK